MIVLDAYAVNVIEDDSQDGPDSKGVFNAGCELIKSRNPNALAGL